MGFTVRKCRLCKQSMKMSPFMMCETCLIMSDKVQQFITKHPQASLEKISLSTNVPYTIIEKMVTLGNVNNGNNLNVH